jgi:hypothetical protein
VSEILRPSVFAVFKLITSSKFVDRCIGRSLGFSPLRNAGIVIVGEVLWMRHAHSSSISRSCMGSVRPLRATSSVITSSHLLLDHKHAGINEAFAGNGGPRCLRALCQFLDTGRQPDFKIADTKPGWGAVGLAVEGLKKGLRECPVAKLRVLH